MRNRLSVVLVAGVVSLSVHAQDVSGWRGDGTGIAKETTVPTRWGAEEGIVWKTPLGNWSNAGPTVVGSRIFVCNEVSTLVCVNKTDGKILWTKTNDLKDLFSEEDWTTRQKREEEFKGLSGKFKILDKQRRDLQTKLRLGTAEGQQKDEESQKKRWERYAERERKGGREPKPFSKPDYGPLLSQEEIVKLKAELDGVGKQRGELRQNMSKYADVEPPRLHPDTGYATPTPISDGKAVYVQFGTGVAACYDLDGERKWLKFVGKCPVGSGLSTTGVLIKDKLILLGDTLKALNKDNGEELWACDRDRGATGSVVAAKIAGQDVVVTAAGNLVQAEDGKLVARGLGRLTFGSPVVQDGVAYFADPQVRAVQLPETLEEGAKPKTLWTADIPRERYYASPLVLDGLLYAVNQKSMLSALDIEKGEIVWSEQLKLRGILYSSITAAGGYLFISAEGGETAVLKPGRQFEQVAVCKLEDRLRACPVFENGRMYVRARSALYCIGK